MQDKEWLVIGHDHHGWHVAQMIEEVGPFALVSMEDGERNAPPELKAELERLGFKSGTDKLTALVLCERVCIIARHTSRESAAEAVKRAKMAEAHARPFWQLAVAHELQARELMQTAARNAAQPLAS